MVLGVTFTGLVLSADASESIGTIDSSFKLTRLCQDTACSDFGSINWKPTINSMTPGALPVTITDTGITGHLWGDEIGWVNLAPTGAGISVNPSTGVITGYAFSNTGSWVNFSPTGQGVTLVDNGAGSNFSGWAWASGANGGWIKFDCSEGATCIKTDWRILSMRANTSSTSGVGGGSRRGLLAESLNTPTPTQQPTTVPGLIPVNSQSLVPDQYSLGTEGPEVMGGPDINGSRVAESHNASAFDRNGDGMPDSGPNNIGASTSNYGFDTDSESVDGNSKAGVYRQLFPLFQPEYQREVDCRLCVVAKKRESDEITAGVRKSVVLIKYGFVPEYIEFGIPIPFTTDTEADTSSLLITVLMGLGLRRLFLRVMLKSV